LCHRTLAAILKYDNEVPLTRTKDADFKKGYYGSERQIVNDVKAAVLRGKSLPEGMDFKTIECQIMDLADDFAYSVYDLEDSLKAGFLTPASILASDNDLFKKVAEKVTEELGRDCSPADVTAIFGTVFADLVKIDDSGTITGALMAFTKAYGGSEQLSQDSYYRTRLSSALIHEFIAGVKFEPNIEHPAMSRAYIEGGLEMKVEVLKQYTYVATIYSARVKLGEYRGSQLVTDIFNALIGKKGDLLMPDDVRKRFLAIPEEDKANRARTVCDFVAGMTDRYAMEFWARLKSDAAESMFKPI
jgi:dGTPase